MKYKIIICFLVFFGIFCIAQNNSPTKLSYQIFRTSSGVKLIQESGTIIEPMRGLSVDLSDSISLPYKGAFVQIKDCSTREIIGFSKTGVFCIGDILETNKVSRFKKFIEKCKSIFGDTPSNEYVVKLSTLGYHMNKGDEDGLSKEKKDSIANILMTQLEPLFNCGNYSNTDSIIVKKVSSADGTFNYSITNHSSQAYAVYWGTISEDLIVSTYSEFSEKRKYGYRPDNFYLLIPSKSSITLDNVVFDCSDNITACFCFSPIYSSLDEKIVYYISGTSSLFESIGYKGDVILTYIVSL